MVPNHQLKGLGKVFSSLKSFVEHDQTQMPANSSEFAVTFLEHHAAQGPSTRTSVDQARQLFFVMFKLAQSPESNPMLSQLGSSARLSLVRSSAVTVKPDPPTVDVARLVSHLSRTSPSSSSPWIDIRNRAIMLYLLVLGRRPCNAAAALFADRDCRVEWGLKVSELGAKGDRSRRGTSVFLQTIVGRPELCPVRAIITYLDHPTTVSVHQRLSKDARPLFIQLEPGRSKNHRIVGATCSAIVSRELRAAGVDVDSSGQHVSARDIRASIYSIGLRCPDLKKAVLRHMLDWKQSSVSDRHYLRGESPVDWPEFILGLREAPGQGFCSISKPPAQPGNSSDPCALRFPTSSVLVDPHLINETSTVMSNNVRNDPLFKD